MSIVRSIFFIAISAVAAGFVWDILVWKLHFPYFPFHWLVRLLHVDGESAYTAMMYEVMIVFFFVFLLAWLALRMRSAR